MNITRIKSEQQYAAYCNRILELSSQEPTQEISDETELLEVLVEKWEQERYAVNDSDPIELLKYLMENHKLKQGDLTDILGIRKSAVSQILNYQKGLSKDVIRKLSDHFKISQEAFNRPYEIRSEANRGHVNEKMMNTRKTLERA